MTVRARAVTAPRRTPSLNAPHYEFGHAHVCLGHRTAGMPRWFEWLTVRDVESTDSRRETARLPRCEGSR